MLLKALVDGYPIAVGPKKILKTETGKEMNVPDNIAQTLIDKAVFEGKKTKPEKPGASENKAAPAAPENKAAPAAPATPKGGKGNDS